MATDELPEYRYRGVPFSCSGRHTAASAAGAPPGITEPPVPPRFRQLATWTEDGEEGIDIMTGVEVADISNLPIDLAGKSVPGCDCLVFTHRGSVARVGESYRSIYERWLPASDRRPALPFNCERYLDGVGDPYAETYVFQICVPVT